MIVISQLKWGWLPTFGNAARLCCLTSQRISSFWNWRHFSTFSSGTRIRMRTRSGSPELIDSSSISEELVSKPVLELVSAKNRFRSNGFERVRLHDGHLRSESEKWKIKIFRTKLILPLAGNSKMHQMDYYIIFKALKRNINFKKWRRIFFHKNLPRWRTKVLLKQDKKTKS